MIGAIWFATGLVVGGLIGGGAGVVVLCCMQINRINDYEHTIRRLKRQIRAHEKEGDQYKNSSIESGE